MKLFKRIPKNYLAILPIFKEEKVQNFTAIVLTFLALSFFGLFAINPTLSTIAQLQKQLSDSKMVDQKLTEKISNLATLQKKYNLLEKDLYSVFLALPEKSNAPYLVGSIQALANKSNLRILRVQSFQVDLTKPKGLDLNYSSLAFSLEGEGKSYTDVANFMNTLLNFDRVVTIDMVSANSNPEKGTLKVSIRGKAHFK
ncbi:MAG: type 4a pilus biogenesis protein PilO [bacterium]|nr:type 4a pilus biogenesis protein PilO [bacterium]